MAENAVLYEVNLSQLLPDELKSSLADISHNFLSGDYLRTLCANPRNCLFLLSDPMESWPQHGSPPVYCVIQVCLEGAIPNNPHPKEGGDKTKEIKYFFIWFPQLPRDDLIGARIVHVSALEEDYITTSLELLASYYNGEMTQEGMVLALLGEGDVHVLAHLRGRKLGKVHYIGVFTEPTIDGYQLWKNRDFSLFFVGKLQENTEISCAMLRPLSDYTIDIIAQNQDCSLDKLFMAFCRIFITLSSSKLSNLDLLLAKSILKHNIELVKERGQVAAEVPWESEFDERRTNAFINNNCTDPEEMIMDLVPEFAKAYFSGKLPIEITDEEESLLLLTGLQMRTFKEAGERLNIGLSNVLSALRVVFVKAMDFYNTLSPEVLNENHPSTEEEN